MLVFGRQAPSCGVPPHPVIGMKLYISKCLAYEYQAEKAPMQAFKETEKGLNWMKKSINEFWKLCLFFNEIPCFLFPPASFSPCGAISEPKKEKRERKEKKKEIQGKNNVSTFIMLQYSFCLHFSFHVNK